MRPMTTGRWASKLTPWGDVLIWSSGSMDCEVNGEGVSTAESAERAEFFYLGLLYPKIIVPKNLCALCALGGEWGYGFPLRQDRPRAFRRRREKVGRKKPGPDKTGPGSISGLGGI